MHARKLIAGAAVVVLAGAGLLATTTTAQAKVPPKPTLAAPAHVVRGHPFSVTIDPKRAGRVVLLRGVGGIWHVVGHRHSAGGKVTFRRTEHLIRTVSYRARVGKMLSTVHRVAVRRPVPPPPTLAISVDSTDDIYVGDQYTVAIEAYRGNAPLPGRTVKVQRLDPGKTAWTTVGSYVTDADGSASLQDSESTMGLVEYRATSGSLNGLTRIPVFQIVTMPGKSGLTVASSTCAGTVTGGDGDVDLNLVPTTKPACSVNVGDTITVTWKLPSSQCTPFNFADFALTGDKNGSATVSVVVDGAQLMNQQLTVGADTGKFSINGDPVDQLVVSMKADTGGQSLTGSITGAQAVCL